MFSFLKSESSKLRETAKNWLYHAGKVYHFRKDRLSDTELSTLLQLSEEVKAGISDKVSDSRLRSSIESLKAHMEVIGGNYYPRGSMAENVEFFFAAIIIYVGFTTFFVKPFKIPTNSMWPTYYGMTGEAYVDEDEAPNGLTKLFRLVAFGATHYDVEAPATGEVLVPVVETTPGSFVPLPEADTVKRYFILNTPGIRRTFFVDGERVSFKFPADFQLDREIIEPLEEQGIKTPYHKLYRRLVPSDFAGTTTETVFDPRSNRSVQAKVYLLKTGIHVEKGDSIVSFDLMTGDQLFVDRMSYHFVSPKVGDGFVFKTDEIPGINEDKFYIKRLAGTPGDKVRIDGSTLMVNDKPAEGSIAFEKNAQQVDGYDGYITLKGKPTRVLLDLSQDVQVPESKYLALGDNSDNSLDGRAWGFVPETAVVGRPIMIYYPFTKRFGLAK